MRSFLAISFPHRCPALQGRRPAESKSAAPPFRDVFLVDPHARRLMCIWRLVPLTSDQVDSTQLHAFASVPLAQDSARRLIKLANLPQAFLPVVARLRKQGAQAGRQAPWPPWPPPYYPQPSKAPSYFVLTDGPCAQVPSRSPSSRFPSPPLV